MLQTEKYTKPTKAEQRMALKYYTSFATAVKQLHTDSAELEIEETSEKIVVPKRALELLEKILKAMSEGNPISVVPMAAEITTQKAAEILGCSRPHLIKLLEQGKIEFTKIGKHRRIKFEHLMAYHKKMKDEQKKNLIALMNHDEESGLYDS